MSLYSRPNGTDDFANEPTLDPGIGALIDTELNGLVSTINALDNANIAATPKIDGSKVDFGASAFLLKSGGTMTGTITSSFDGNWRVMRASGNAQIREYRGGNAIWGIVYNTNWNGASWDGRDFTDICLRLELSATGFEVYHAPSAAGGVTPVWTKLFSSSPTAMDLIGALTFTESGDEYIRVPRLTTVQRDALSALLGMLIFNSTTGLFNIYQSAAWRTLVTRDESETLTNKTLTTPIITDFGGAVHNHSGAGAGGALGLNAVPSVAIQDGAITTAKLATSAVTIAKLSMAQGSWSSSISVNGSSIVTIVGYSHNVRTRVVYSFGTGTAWVTATSYGTYSGGADSGKMDTMKMAANSTDDGYGAPQYHGTGYIYWDYHA